MSPKYRVVPYVVESRTVIFSSVLKALYFYNRRRGTISCDQKCSASYFRIVWNFVLSSAAMLNVYVMMLT